MTCRLNNGLKKEAKKSKMMKNNGRVGWKTKCQYMISDSFV